MKVATIQMLSGLHLQAKFDRARVLLAQAAHSLQMWIVGATMPLAIEHGAAARRRRSICPQKTGTSGGSALERRVQ